MSTPDVVDRGRAPVPPAWDEADTLPLGPPPAGGPPETGGGHPGDSGGGHGHRRRLWLTVAAVAAVVLLVPLLAYAIARTGGEDDQPAAPRPTQPAPTEPAVPSPTTAPTEPPAAVPDGRIPMSVLRNATVFIPAWPSDAFVIGPSGWVRFTNGQNTPANGDPLHLTEAAYGDVDHDGAQETVVSVFAGYEGGSWQLLALDRDANGKIMTIGRVVATTGQIKRIGDFSVTQAGYVRVRVADFLVCCGEDGTLPQWQTRSYAWRSGKFVLVAGPSTFPPNPRVTDLAVSAAALVLGPAVDGVRHGTLRVTVTVRKVVRPDHVALMFQMPADLIREGDGWTGERVEPQGGGIVWVHLDNMYAPAVGASRTYAFNLGRTGTASQEGSLAVTVAGRTDANKAMADVHADDNAVTVAIRTTA
ncbi:hypothetical protein GCM10023170_095800 [Phytohabitans houttuyneae]|uniref:Uncharacterized protein n=1 Tax=Phytohabitans houttuyneae TaxID=1076126 RepID=A0A6V8KJ13_9ACTN|nr:hypothetical protein Phou_058770 [Phytohabitans houttuyneae]